MALPSSGSISIQDIVNEFGGSAPHSLSEYYRGGAYVPNAAPNANIPTSGAIGLGNFYGATKRITVNLTIGSNTQNINLLTLAQSNGYVSGITDVILTINSGIIIGSSSNSTYALYIDNFSSGDVITVTNNGYIVGKGGNATTTVGGNGGSAIYTRFACTLYNNGIIGGGGGAGGTCPDNTTPAVSGGGGAGDSVGLKYPGFYENTVSANGTLTSGGQGGMFMFEGGFLQGGSGGALGSAGQTAYAYNIYSGLVYKHAGGNGGTAVNGDSYITWSTLGDIRGARSN